MYQIDLSMFSAWIDHKGLPLCYDKVLGVYFDWFLSLNCSCRGLVVIVSLLRSVSHATWSSAIWVQSQDKAEQ